MFTGSLPLFILTRIRDILAPEKDLKAKFTLKRKINARLKKKSAFIYILESAKKTLHPQLLQTALWSYHHTDTVSQLQEVSMNYEGTPAVH